MDVLITGDLYSISQQLSEQLSSEHRVVLAAKEISKKLPKKAVTFSFEPKDPMFSKLFKSFSFGSVIFLATRGEQGNKQRAGNLENLDAVLRFCIEHKVPQVIVVSSTEVYSGNTSIKEATVPTPLHNAGYILMTMEALCQFYKQKSNTNIAILHVPYVFGDHSADSLLSKIIVKASRNEAVKLPGSREQLCDFVKDTDIARLIGKIIDEGYHDPDGVINVGSGNPITFKQLASLICDRFPKCDLTFSNDTGSVPPPVSVETARKNYDWVALNDLAVQFEITTRNTLMDLPDRVTKWSAFKEKLPKYKILLQGIELVLGFLLMQYLNSVTQASVQFRFVDFRLLFVIILGSVHGMFVGIIAALLACVSCILSYASQGLSWQVLIYNVDNWLPFVAYLIAGAVTGYTKDKNANAYQFQKSQMDSLEEQYIFLYELYDQTLKNKSMYKDQLMSYRDSFGRIYSITQKLDSVISDQVFQEAINVLEDVLDNQNIAVYTVTPGNGYARLQVSSRGLSEKIASSIELAKYSSIMKNLQKDEVWYNTDMLDEYPAYCAPVFDQDRLVALIMIFEASFKQMATYYVNLIKIICGLIQASLIRAANYSSAAEEKMYIAGTRILKREKFLEVLSVKQKMKEEQTADYKLLRIEGNTKDLKQMNSLIDKGIRKTDVAGQGQDGSVYLILHQVKHSGVGLVLNRLRQLGLSCNLLEQNDKVII